MLTVLLGSCRNTRSDIPETRVIRFDKLIFSTPANAVADTIRLSHPKILPFFSVFNEEIIRIGPDSLPDYPVELEKFRQDPVISSVYNEIDHLWNSFTGQVRLIQKGMEKLAGITGTPGPLMVTFLSGFNESFITLPHLLGIGLDKYMGADYPYYQELRIPAYLRAGMNPENLAPDAIRAWLISEMTPLPPGASFLDHLVYQGKIHYLLQNLLPGVQDHLLFHFSPDQLKWCRDNEKAMWKFLAEQKIIFSTDRMTIRKFMDDAPFTKDFGDESPGKTGCWIGYRILSEYIKNSKTDKNRLFEKSDSQSILAASKYRP